ncbi:MAG TPA: hypothetical protein V6D48_11325 [Oculatellaceae cyanobacterium]
MILSGRWEFTPPAPLIKGGARLECDRAWQDEGMRSHAGKIGECDR